MQPPVTTSGGTGASPLLRGLHVTALLLGALLTLAPAGTAAQAAAGSETSVRDALANLKSSGSYQFELPDAPKPKASEAASKTERPETKPGTGKNDDPGGFELPELPNLLPSSMPAELKLLFWIVVLAALCFAVLPLLSELTWRVRRGSSPKGTGAGDREERRPGEASRTPAHGPAEQAQALAAAGDFSGAVRRLWLGALEELGRRGMRNVRPSETGRDVLRSVQELKELAGAIGTLVRKVEVSHFGGRALGSSDFSEGLDAFRRVEQLIGRTRSATPAGS